MKPDPVSHCYDCQAPIGQEHLDGCDVARCYYCGTQMLQCNSRCERQKPRRCDVWTGYWAGELECFERGWTIKWTSDYHWEGCSPDHPDAQPNMNRLSKLKWDRQQQKYVD